jgi:hypothetical protein
MNHEKGKIKNNNSNACPHFKGISKHHGMRN